MLTQKLENIVYIHGWGEDSRIWENVVQYLPDVQHHFIDLGFISKENDSVPQIQIPELENAFFVTHSLGTLWGLNHISVEQIKGLIAINGFGSFSDFASNKTLKIMANSLQRNIFYQMEAFWKNCNFPENMQQIYKPMLNRMALSQGLAWLGSWDVCRKLQGLGDRCVPVLPLGSECDLILPLDKMRAHWERLGYDVVIKEDAGHSLPVSHPQWCAQQITEFISLAA